MGYSLIWLAVRGRSPEEVREGLGLQLTGHREEIAEAPTSSITMPNGWYVIVANGFDESFVDESVLSRLSEGSVELVTCFVEEHVMVSEASEWREGKQLWRVVHQSDQSIFHLDTEGQLPAVFKDVLKVARTQQKKAGGQDADVDYLFDVPVKIAESRVGYTYNRDQDHPDVEPYEILEPVPVERRGIHAFISRLFRH